MVFKPHKSFYSVVKRSQESSITTLLGEANTNEINQSYDKHVETLPQDYVCSPFYIKKNSKNMFINTIIKEMDEPIYCG